MRNRTFTYLLKQGLREIRSLWKQFLAIVAMGAIAVTLFVGLQANADGLRNRLDGLYRAGNLADTYVTVNPLKGNQGELTEIRSLLGDKGSVEGRFYSFAHINTNNAYCAISPAFPTISKPSEMTAGPDQTAEDFFVVDSVLCTDKEVTNSDEKMQIGKEAKIEFDLSAFVKEGFIENAFISIDDFRPFLKEGVAIEDTPLRNLNVTLNIPVTGYMNHPENVLKASYAVSVFLLSSSMFAKAFDAYLAKFFTEEGADLFYGALSLSPLQWERERLARFPVPDQFLVKLKPGVNQDVENEKIREYFDKKVEEEKNLISIQKKEDTSFASVMEMEALQARQLTFVFPFVFFAVAILVILTTMSQLILKERTQIGTLKALGFSSAMIRRYYAAITLGVAGVGTLIGEILGPLIIPGILNHKYTILYNLPSGGFVFPFLAAFLTAAVFLSLAALVCYLTCRKESSLLPAESMRPSAKSFGKKTSNSKNLSKNCTVFSLLMAVRNILHNRTKSLMVVFGVMGCTALLCCGFGIDDTIQRGLHTDPYIVNGSDITLTLTGEIKENQLEEDLLNLVPDTIKGYQGFTRNNTEVVFEGKSVSTYYQILGTFHSLDGSEDPKNFPCSWQADQVLMTKKIADKLNVQKGDSVHFSINGKGIDAVVFSIDDIFYSNGVFIYSNSPLFEGENVTKFSSYYTNMKEGVDFGVIKEKMKTLSYVASVDTSSDWFDKLNDVVSSISVMTMAVKVFAILLAIVVLYNLSLLNFKERSRDIATMKVLGFSRIEIALSLFFETMTLTALGVSIGLALGFPFLYLVLYINQVEVVSYLYTVSFLSYLAAFGATFGVAAIINFYLASRTNKVKMVESLKSVE